MSSQSAEKIHFTSFKELFKDHDVKIEDGQIVRMNLQSIIPFKNHPFRVVEDESMKKLVNSIKQNGVLEPGIVRKNDDGVYEMISGHRRKLGCELAGYDDMPVIIRNLTDDEATIIMVDSNIQREDILPSEKAWAYRMKMDALRHQGAKREQASADFVGEAAGDSGRTVQRYIRLTYLLNSLLVYVDQKKLLISAGEMISFLNEAEQQWVLNAIDDECGFPSKNQAAMLKKESSIHILSEDRVREILYKQKKTEVFKFSADRVRDFFPIDYTKEQMEAVIIALLSDWKKNH